LTCAFLSVCAVLLNNMEYYNHEARKEPNPQATA